MKWITNAPKDPYDSETAHWARQFRKGRPKATDHYTSEELELMGMVGLYERELPSDIMRKGLDDVPVYAAVTCSECGRGNTAGPGYRCAACSAVLPEQRREAEEA